MDEGTVLWKFECDLIIFLGFVGVESLKYKKARGPNFFGEYNIISQGCDWYHHFWKWLISIISAHIVLEKYY